MADYNYITEFGVIVPDISVVNAEVKAEWKGVFGNDLNVSPKTPQGAQIVSETVARANVLRNNAQMANQLNPNEAVGILLDAIMALTGIERTPNQFTLVSGVNLTGTPSTTIPSDSQASETVNGEIFNLVSDILLDTFGNGVGIFQAINPGAIAAAANTLTKIESGPLGWETVNNATAGVLGALQQSDVAARSYRRQTLATQGSSLAEAVTSAVRAVPGVLSLSFRENRKATTQVIDGITMVPNSIYACVDGGTDLDVADALASKKSGGCDYNNGMGVPVSETITQPFSGQVMDILFDRPEILEILVQIVVKSSSAIQDPTAIVKQAIEDYQNGEIDGENGLQVGVPVSAFELAGAVNVESPGIFVTSCKISLVTPLSFSCDEIPVELWQKANIAPSNITVTVI